MTKFTKNSCKFNFSFIIVGYNVVDISIDGKSVIDSNISLRYEYV